MTTEKCELVCSGYTYFGLEYGRECFGGNVLNAGSVPASISECNFQCSGKNTEFCGAGNRLNLYKNGATTNPSSSSSALSSSATTSAESSSTTDPSSSSSTTSIEISSTSSSESSSSSVATTTSESSYAVSSSTKSAVESTTTTTSTTESSTTTTTTASTTTITTIASTSPTPTPNVVINGGFEGDTSPWVLRQTNPSWYKYNLADTSIAANTGSNTGSITYLRGSLHTKHGSINQ